MSSKNSGKKHIFMEIRRYLVLYLSMMIHSCNPSTYRLRQKDLKIGDAVSKKKKKKKYLVLWFLSWEKKIPHIKSLSSKLAEWLKQ
jgi:hypothetical protein